MSWTTTRLKHVCLDAGQYGLNISAQDHASSGYRLIRTSDIDEAGSLRSRDNAVFVEDPADDRFKLREGDLLLSRSGTLGRAMLLRSLEEPSTYAGYLVRFRPHAGTEPRFLSYVTVSKGFQSAIEADATTSTIQNFNAERYANISLAIPSLDEQRRIADFLDAETGRLDQIHRRRARQVEILGERCRRSVDALFGVQRSSQVRVKDLLRSKPRYGVLVPDFVDEGVPFVRVNDLIDLTGKIAGLRKIPADLSNQYRTTIVKEGDVLVSVVGTLGRSVVATSSLAGANVNRAIAILRVRPGVCPKLLSAWTRTIMFETQATLATASDSAQRTLGMEDLANFRIVWPVDNQGQVRAVAALAAIEKECSDVRLALDRQLALIQERRQALITAAVTGEIDVATARGVDV